MVIASSFLSSRCKRISKISTYSRVVLLERKIESVSYQVRKSEIANQHRGFGQATGHIRQLVKDDGDCRQYRVVDQIERERKLCQRMTEPFGCSKVLFGKARRANNLK